MEVMEESGELTRTIQRAEARGDLSPEAVAGLRQWLEEPQYAGFRKDIIRLIHQGNWQELKDSFYTIIPFGTGGRRGRMGVGPNRMNLRTVGESTQGLCRYIASFGEEATRRGVVVAYDTRHRSREFAEETARVCAGNGVKAYLFDDFRPTPELSFAVRRLRAQAGVVISASHNPPSDNGYKVCWEDGAQIVWPHDERIIEEVNKVTDIKAIPLDDAARQGLLEEIGAEVDDAFIDTVCRLALTSNRKARIVYSPLHGTGTKTVVPVLREAGFEDLHVVAEQATPDPDFSTVPDNKPNPEEPRALELLMRRAEELNADIALATDPDADRVACAVKERLPDGTEHWKKLTGNQVACLICHFVLSELDEQHRLPEQAVVVRTIVTTQELDLIAADFGVEIINHLLVGFKYIGEQIRLLPPEKEFIFGAEESLGYLRGTYARDKDAAGAALALCEMAATLKARGTTLTDYLNGIYRTYGYYGEYLRDLQLEGQEGQQQIRQIMEALRKATPTEIGGRPITRVTDRLTLTERDLRTGEERGGVEGISGDLLLLHFNGDVEAGRIACRPSGTEPKMKFYVTVRKDVPATITEAALYDLKQETNAEAVRLMDAFGELARRIAGVG